MLGGSALGLAVVLAALAIGSSASGAGNEADLTSAVLVEVEHDATQHPVHLALVADPVRRAKTARERATRLRQAGDEERARVAEGIAAEWANLARDLIRTADAEDRAARARRNADDAGAQAERERALLDEGLAQNGRLKAQIEEAQREGKEEPAHTSKLGASLDAGVPAVPRHGATAPANGEKNGEKKPSGARGAVDGGAP